MSNTQWHPNKDEGADGMGNYIEKLSRELAKLNAVDVIWVPRHYMNAANWFMDLEPADRHSYKLLVTTISERFKAKEINRWRWLYTDYCQARYIRHK